MGRDARRTTLVVGDDVDLFAALRPEVDPAMVQLTWTTPDELPAAIAAAVPWPWAVSGSGNRLDGSAVNALRGMPVLWFWLGSPPAAAPAGTRQHDRWRGLLDDLRTCLARNVAGVRLAPNRGLLDGVGGLILSPELEGLLAAAPLALPLSSRAAIAAARAIERHRLPLSLRRDGDAVALAEIA
ncbi:MAG: hypothetical protein M3010_05275 [Candidatus Dormibacteraeota bacterium]|nr:hypothetical protein [Candidatus Dormibacteraeota bacterium]